MRWGAWYVCRAGVMGPFIGSLDTARATEATTRDDPHGRATAGVRAHLRRIKRPDAGHRDGPARIDAQSHPDPQAITAVALGGTSLFGGVATIIGTVIGVWIPAVLQNGLIIVKVNPYWQLIAVGVVLVIAVAMDQWRRRGQNRR